MAVFEGGFDSYVLANSKMTNLASHDMLKNRIMQRINSFTNHDHSERLLTTLNTSMGTKALNKIMSFRRNVASMFKNDNVIIQLKSTIDDLQFPPLRMIPYLMAQPKVNKLYADGMIEGYRDRYTSQKTYVDPTSNPFYREVMNGIVEETNGVDTWVEYSNDNGEYDDLLPQEQFMILDSWESILTSLMHGSVDVTSKWGNSL
jgi:hypothetical protein